MKRQSVILSAVIIFLFAVAIIEWWFHQNSNFLKTNSAKKTANEIQFVMSTKQKKVVNNYITLSRELLKNPVIVDAIIKGNIKNKHLTKSQILALDDQWKISTEQSNLINQFLTNPCALKLKEFQKSYPEFIEIFITDQYGLNVCQTNKTSDYYQADEEWWQKSYANGKGETYSGSLEYDESAASVAIPVYVPIKDPNTNNVIGISKLVLSIESIR